MLRALFLTCLVLVWVFAGNSLAEPVTTNPTPPSDSGASRQESNRPQTISLTKSFFGDSRYSIDGVTYNWVSASGAELLPLLKGDDALSALSRYRHLKYTSHGFRYVALAVVGASLVFALEDEPGDGKALAFYGGVPVVALSMITNAMAEHQLRKSVRFHNNAVAEQNDMATLGIVPVLLHDNVGCALTLRF